MSCLRKQRGIYLTRGLSVACGLLQIRNVRNIPTCWPLGGVVIKWMFSCGKCDKRKFDWDGLVICNQKQLMIQVKMSHMKKTSVRMMVSQHLIGHYVIWLNDFRYSFLLK